MDYFLFFCSQVLFVKIYDPAFLHQQHHYYNYKVKYVFVHGIYLNEITAIAIRGPMTTTGR